MVLTGFSLTVAEIGRRVYRRRKALDLTQNQVEELADIGSGYLSRLENDKGGVRLPDLLKISSALRMNPAELLMGADTARLVEQVGQIPAPDEVVRLFERIAGVLPVLGDEDRQDVIRGIGLVANILERKVE